MLERITVGLETKKIFTNVSLSYLDKIGKSVRAALKNENDPTSAYETPNLFVPSEFYCKVMKPLFNHYAAKTFRLNKYIVHAVDNGEIMSDLLQEDNLSATWGSVTTRVLSTPNYPFNFRYSKDSECLKCIFVANARRGDGTIVLSYNQRL